MYKIIYFLIFFKFATSMLIYARVGNDVELKCQIDSRKYPNVNFGINFFNDSAIINSGVVVVDNYNVHLLLKNITAQKSTIYCKTKDNDIVDLYEIRCGTIPRTVKNFTCISKYWRSMDCFFETDENPITVKYTITYQVNNQIYNCIMTSKNACGVTSYRRFDSNFSFLIIGKNSIGETKQTELINNFDSILPESPKNLKIRIAKNNYIRLYWTTNVLPENLTYHYRFKFLSICETKIINVKKRGGKNARKFSDFFPNVNYNVSIQIRTSSTRNLWSDYSEVVYFKTFIKVPSVSPIFHNNGFSFAKNGDLFLYLKPLKKCLRNEQNYTMSISEYTHIERIGNNMFLRTPINQLNFKFFTQIKQFPVISSLNYLEFIIISANSLGAINEAKTRIPNKHTLLSPPSIIKKSNSTHYIISWNHSNVIDNIKSITLFWCRVKNELPNRCQTPLKSKNINLNQNEFIYKSQKSLNFAISIHSTSSSSGMVWSECTTSNDDEIGIVKSFLLRAIQWKLVKLDVFIDCKDVGIVQLIEIEYNKSNSNSSLSIFIKQNELPYTFNDLVNDTVYTFRIRLHSIHTIGAFSQYLSHYVHLF